MSRYRVTTYRDGQVVQETVVEDLAVVNVKGFVLADDRSWAIVFEPILEAD